MFTSIAQVKTYGISELNAAGMLISQYYFLPSIMEHAENYY